MSSKCRHRYCVLLSLLLGAGAWWFVSWLTTPQPLWVRSFLSDNFVEEGSLNEGLSDPFFTIAQDRLCIRPSFSHSGYEEHIEIATGRTISRTKYKFDFAEDSNEVRPASIMPIFGKQNHEYDCFTVEIGFSPAFLYYLVPSDWESALAKITWLPQWMNGVHIWLHLRDRKDGKILIKAKAHSWSEYFLTNQWFIVIGEEEVNGKTIFRVQAFEIPATTWSPWWGPGVGFVVVIAFWVLLWSVARRSAKPVEPWRNTFHEQQV